MQKAIVGTISVWCFLLLGTIGTATADEPKLIVGVINNGVAPDRILCNAMAAAQRIFDQGGIATEWVDRSSRPDRPVMLNLRIYPGRVRYRPDPKAFGAALLAPAEAPSDLADIYYGRIEDQGFTAAGVALLLAHVMAHEVGHLLLGREHSAIGLMRAQWSFRDMLLIRKDRLRFSQADVARLQVAVKTRSNALDVVALR